MNKDDKKNIFIKLNLIKYIILYYKNITRFLMRFVTRVNILFLISLWIFIGCNTTDKSSREAPVSIVAGASVEVMDASSDNYKVLKLNGDKRLQVKLGNEKKDLYILFSNPENSMNSATVNHNRKIVEGLSFIKKEFRKNNTQSLIMHSSSHIQDFNNRTIDLNSNEKRALATQKIFKTISDVEDESHKEFYMEVDSKDLKVDATARKVIKYIKTQFG
jgi:hypothetical protein